MAFEDILYPLLKPYIASPQWVKRIIGGSYALIPSRMRLGMHYSDFVQTAALSDPTDLLLLMRHKLLQTLRWATLTVPAYKRYAHLLQSASEQDVEEILREFPTTEKRDIKQDATRYISDSVAQQSRLPAFTGGSTAEPMRLYLEKHVTRPKEHAFMTAFQQRLGMNERHVVLALRGRSVPSAARRHGSLWMYDPVKRQLILSADHLERRFMQEYVEALRRWRPQYIQAFPSALYPLALWLKAHPAPDISERIRGIMLYSENVYGFQMALLREVFTCPILKHYGHSERVLMAASMPDDERYFFWPQYGYLELVDASGRRITQAGELGEIVGTSFDNRVMPFLRYRTGDLATLSGAPPHSDLPGYIAVEKIEGRLQEFLVCHDHRLISLTTIGAAHLPELHDVAAIQYEQRSAGKVLFKVVSARPLDRAQRQTINHAIYQKTQGGCEVDTVQVESIPRTARGKHRLLIQHLDLSSYLGASGYKRT